MKKFLKAAVCAGVFSLCAIGPVSDFSGGSAAQAANPYLPLWEYIPDGEPYVFEDPDTGEDRVYIYGSHDTKKNGYCGDDLVAWSAPLDDLTDWRYEGVIFESIVDGTADTLFAPDIALVEEDGVKTYYLYPNNQGGGRNSMVAKSDSPTGPFEVCNWKDGSTTETEGCLGFDPAVFVDDDGRVYGYWGFESSNGAELDPETMASVKPGTETVTDMIPSCNADDGNDFRFFEASSLRKISKDHPDNQSGKDRYIFIYSRKTKDGEFGMGASNSTLAYAYSDNPLGPWTYGGTLVDARGRDIDANGNPISSIPSNNTHGSIVEINGQWWCFYHRAVSGAYSRQAMAAPVDVSISADGSVHISEAEVTSEGFETDGLDPDTKYSAGIASFVRNGSQITAAYDKEEDSNPVVGNKNGSIVGFKYYNFDGDVPEGATTQLTLDVIPQGAAGTVKIMLDRPYETSSVENNTGTVIGEINIPARTDGQRIQVSSALPALDDVNGKHAVYLVFESEDGGEICDLHYLQFSQVTDYINSDSPEESWEVVSGQPVISGGSISLSSGDAVQAANGQSWENYAVSASLDISGGETGIQVRKEDSQNYYLVKADGKELKLISVVNGKERILRKTDLTSNTPDITVNCVNDTISVRVDGAAAMAVSNSDHRAGTAGFFAGENSSAEITGILIRNCAQADALQRTDTITVDGQPLTGYQVDVEEYTVVTDSGKIPVVEASTTDPSVRVTVAQAGDVPGSAVVQFDGSITKTYTIHFVTNETTDWGNSLPEGWEIINPSDPENNLQFNGTTLTITGVPGADYPDCSNRLQMNDELKGNWSVVVKGSSDANTADMAIYTQYGIGVFQNGKSITKLNIEKNWGETSTIAAFDGKQTGAGGKWNYWLKLTKNENTLSGYYSADGVTYSFLKSKTIDGSTPCMIQLYATPQKGTNEFKARFSDLSIETVSPGVSTETSESVEMIRRISDELDGIILVPSGDYSDAESLMAAALAELKNTYPDADFSFSGSADYPALTIKKGTAFSVIQAVWILEEHSFEELQTLIGEAASLNPLDYTEDSMQRVNNASAAAEEITEDSGAFMISLAYERLESSINVLEEAEYVESSIDILESSEYTNADSIRISVIEGSRQSFEKLTVIKDGKEAAVYAKSDADEVSGRNYIFTADFTADGFGDGSYTFEALIGDNTYTASVISDRTLPSILFDEETGQVTVSDDNLDTVTLDGISSESAFVLTDDEVHRVQAADKAGNTSMLEVQKKAEETDPSDKPGEDETTGKPDPDKSSDTPGEDELSGGSNGNSTSHNVQTGDSTVFTGWLITLAAALLVSTGCLLIRKRKK